MSQIAPWIPAANATLPRLGVYVLWRFKRFAVPAVGALVTHFDTVCVAVEGGVVALDAFAEWMYIPASSYVYASAAEHNPPTDKH